MFIYMAYHAHLIYFMDPFSSVSIANFSHLSKSTIKSLAFLFFSITLSISYLTQTYGFKYHVYGSNSQIHTFSLDHSSINPDSYIKWPALCLQMDIF